MGKTLKVDIHTIKENQNGGELNTTKKGRFSRISVELNLDKKFVSRIKIRNRTYKIEYESLNLLCFTCGRYGNNMETCPLSKPPEINQNLEGEGNNNCSHTQARMR